MVSIDTTTARLMKGNCTTFSGKLWSVGVGEFLTRRASLYRYVIIGGLRLFISVICEALLIVTCPSHLDTGPLWCSALLVQS